MHNDKPQTLAGTARFVNASALALPVALLCGVAWGVGAARAFTNHLGQDQSWLLYVAQVVLHGAKLDGSQIVETNPPFVVWFTMIPVLLGRMLHIGSINGFRWFWLGLAAASGGWSASLFRRLYRPTKLGFWLFVLLESMVGLLAINAEDLGQREHLTALYLLPYLLCAAFRIERRSLGRIEAALIGLAASFAVCLKPQQAFDVVLVEALVLVHLRSLREWIHVSTVFVCVGVAAYLGCVAGFGADYVKYIVPQLQQTYWGFDETWPVVFSTARVALVVWAIGVAMFVGLRQRLKMRVFALVLLVGSVGAMFAFLQQHKGWHYQLICFVVFSCMLVGLMCVDVVMQWMRETNVAAPLRVRQPMLLALCCFVVSLGLLTHWRREGSFAQPHKQDLEEIYAAYPSGTSVQFVSVFAWEFPAVLEQGKVLGSRYMHFWMLPAVIRSEFGYPYELKRELKPEVAAEVSARLRQSEAEDLARWKPAVVVVDRCAMLQFCDDALKKRLGSLLGWFEVDAGFRDQWQHYRYQRSVDDLDVYTRTP